MEDKKNGTSLLTVIGVFYILYIVLWNLIGQSIEPGVEYGWSDGIIHGMYCHANKIWNWWHEDEAVLVKADMYTTMYYVWYYVFWILTLPIAIFELGKDLFWLCLPIHVV